MMTVRGASGGERDALEQLVERHQAWVYNIAVRMLAHPHDAEDATQGIRLSRARRDLHSFMNDKCGLVNSTNPCRCAKKTRGFMPAGYVDPANLLFARARITQVRDVVPATARAVATLDEPCARIYREHPLYEPPDIARALRRRIDSSDFRRAVDLP